MNNETQRRIKAYKAALPELRERVIAVALLLAMSASMLASASFAWLTLSVSPEVSGVSTTLAANGNLEIALSDKDGEKPEESAVGDSSAAEGNNVVAANLTWGNLINLTHESYGLEELALRPAILNTVSLTDSPLYGAVYGLDGRIEELNSNFAYTTWVEKNGDIPGYFGVPEGDAYGVRAISSTEIRSISGDTTFLNMISAADTQNMLARSEYLKIADEKRYMQSLATLMGHYMTARMNPSDPDINNPVITIEVIEDIRDMYDLFIKAIDEEAKAMAKTVDVYRYLAYGAAYVPCTIEEIYNKTYADPTPQYKNNFTMLEGIDIFVSDRAKLLSDYEKLAALADGGAASYTWNDSGIKDIVNNLVNVGACTVGTDNKKISDIGATAAMNYVNGVHPAKITNGVLYNFELRTGAQLVVDNGGKGLSITATIGRDLPLLGYQVISEDVSAIISTTASENPNYYYAYRDLERAKKSNTGNYVDVDYVAQDTYGLAIDFWLRTNAEGSYLTLEGNVFTQTETKEVKGIVDEKEVQLYTYALTVTDEESGESSDIVYDLYQYTPEGSDTYVWYDYATKKAATIPDDAEPVKKIEEIEKVVGYEGVNRVWENNSQIPADLTTQGSGSCYIYYTDTPEDMARSLRLLKAFRVALVDANGKLLTIAEMDTEHAFQDVGRVIVPLVLPMGSIDLGEDYEGNEIRGIMPLEKNVPTRVTAIVYLDGDLLENQDVLAAADIQGQLNIQFGSSQNLIPIEDTKLQADVRTASATVSKSNFNYSTDTDLSTTVTVTVTGTQPEKLTGFFLRKINSTQGSREKEMIFEKNSEGQWVATHTFTSPGTYILRTIQMDGAEYVLPAESTPTVTVEGFTVSKLVCDQADGRMIKVVTAAGGYPITMRLTFASDEGNATKMPTTVEGMFFNDEDGAAVPVKFTLNPTTQEWLGSANFLASGKYTMQHLVMNGEYTELPEGLHHKADISLGMRAAVYTTSPQRITYTDNLPDNANNLAMQVKILDNGGKELTGLTGLRLIYGRNGSNIDEVSTELNWTGTYYTGTLANPGPGVWKFNNVYVDSENSIGTATTYPTFTIMPPDLPKYAGNNNTTELYAANGNAELRLSMTNASAATVQAEIVNRKTPGAEGTWVTGTPVTVNGITTFSFKIPDTLYDGYSKISRLRFWDVIKVSASGDITEITEDNPIYMDDSEFINANGGVDEIYAKVIKTVTPVFVTNADGSPKTYLFEGNAMLEPYTMDISDAIVQFRDFENQPIRIPDSLRENTSVKLTFTYDPSTSYANGYYTVESTTTDAGTVTPLDDYTISISLVTTDGQSFVQGDAIYPFYAGVYTVSKLEYTIMGQSATVEGAKMPVNTPGVVLKSVRPTVSISAITPNKTHTAYDADDNKQTVTSKIDGNTATVYCEKTSTNDGKIQTYPTVTLMLQNMGSAESAALVFTANSGDTYMYPNVDMTGGQTNAFAWTAGTNTCQRYVGRFKKSGTCSGMTRIGAGTLTSSSNLNVVYADMNFEVELSNTITIVNPF